MIEISSSDRIKEERKRLGLTQSEAGNLCGVTRETWGKYERGVFDISGSVLRAFSNAGADVDYITTGVRRTVFEQTSNPVYSSSSNNTGSVLTDWRGKMRLSQEAMAKEMGISRNTYWSYERGNTKPTVEFLDQFSKVTGAPLNVLLSCLLSDMSSEDAQKIGNALKTAPKTETNTEDAYVTVPRYDVRASAGHGQIVHSELIVDHLSFKNRWIAEKGLNPDRLALIEIRGDSMEPSLHNGDMILLDLRAQRLTTNGIYVIQHNGHLLVKRIQVKMNGSVLIKSDNPAYEVEVLSPSQAESVIVVGRVVWYFREI